MDIDCTPVPPTHEYTDQYAATTHDHRRRPNHSTPMNYNYLNALNAGGRQSPNAAAASDSIGSATGQRSTNAAGYRARNSNSVSPALFYLGEYNEMGVGGGNSAAAAASAEAGGTSHGFVDDRVPDRPVNMNERFVTALDNLDARVEKFRKEALNLQEKRDYLLLSIDLMKSHDMLSSMMECEREEIDSYIQRVNSRLSTVELNVRTVRDPSQEDALSQINALIDAMITMGDPTLSRQRCQQYLNSCSAESHPSDSMYVHEELVYMGMGSGASGGVSYSSSSSQAERDIGPVDKKFESALLGCTLDDQKNVKKRLQALMNYLNKQTIHMH